MNNIPPTADSVPRPRSAGESFWRQTLAAFSAGGQAPVSFCQARGLKLPTFYAWRARLSERDRPDIAPALGRSRSAGPAFVPVVVEPRLAGTQDAIQVELRGGRVMRLPASMPAARLAEVLHALEGQA
jgi:hypothetical protein